MILPADVSEGVEAMARGLRRDLVLEGQLDDNDDTSRLAAYALLGRYLVLLIDDESVTGEDAEIFRSMWGAIRRGAEVEG